MTIEEAKEQIAKERGFKNWDDLKIQFTPDVNHYYNERILEAYVLLVSSKDKEIAELKAENNKLLELNKTIMGNRNEWEEACKKAESELSQLKDEKGRLTKDNTSNVKYTLDLKKQIQSLQEEIKRKEEVISEAHKKFNTLNHEYKALTFSSNQLREEMKKKEERVFYLERKLSGSEPSSYNPIP